MRTREVIEQALDEGSLRVMMRPGHLWACRRAGKTKVSERTGRFTIMTTIGRGEPFTITSENMDHARIVLLLEVTRPAFTEGTSVPTKRAAAPPPSRKRRKQIEALICGPDTNDNMAPREVFVSR